MKKFAGFVAFGLIFLASEQIDCAPSVAGGVALPALVTRATDSLSALLSPRSAAPLQQQQQQQSQSVTAQATDAQPVAIAAPPAATSNTNQQQAIQAQQQRPTLLLQPLQAQLSAIQSQAQRHISQLNGIMINGASQLANSPLAAHAANLTAGNTQYAVGNVLEVLSNVGKAIQQQIGAAQQIQIVSASPSNSAEQNQLTLANTKKNEYQPLEQQQQQATNVTTSTSVAGQQQLSVNQYREQGEQLRQEIVRRAGQLQQVVASSMEVLKNNGDLIVRRLLEQLNNRLDQAKSKADKIINEVSFSS